MPTAEKDFFISYNQHDREIAEWIGWELEEAKYSVAIQAWDFTGNWVKEMDDAMQYCKRTIVVLSPDYLTSNYTFTEWANAFVDDARGEQEKLIPIRVADVELKGILRQLVYIDFVGKKEAEAKEALLKRVRGERGKPSIKPAFSLGKSATEIKHKAVLQKPVFPAMQEDEKRIKKLRALAIKWREKYYLHTGLMEEHIQKLEAWRKNPPVVFDKYIDAVIKFAYQVAQDFQNLPVAELKEGTSYGLDIHPTIFWGQAIDQAFHLHDTYDERSIELYRETAAILETKPLMPDKYNYEMLERLLRSALSLARFDISNLPRGYLSPTVEDTTGKLDTSNMLAIAQLNYDDPRLYLIKIGQSVQKLLSFTARSLTLYYLDARLNSEGEVDLLAYDDENLYVWQSSVLQPVYQFFRSGIVLAAALRAIGSGPWATYLTSKRSLYNIAENGTLSEVPNTFQSLDLKDAVFWTDPLKPTDWYLIVSTDKYQVYSALHGKHLSGELNQDGNFWNDPVFISEKEREDHRRLSEYFKAENKENKYKLEVRWESECKLKATTLDGLPCLLLYRHAVAGTRVCFLDPASLAPLRRPVIVEGFLTEVSVACGRWLVVGFFQRGEASPRIKVWDLKPSQMAYCGGWLHDEGDIYYPLVVSETKTSFQLLFAHRYLSIEQSNNWKLMTFDWPNGEIKEVEKFKNLRLGCVRAG